MPSSVIISVDGHVKPSRSAYRDYLDPEYRAQYDERNTASAGTPDGFVRADFGEDAQWDAERRMAAMESQGVVAEVLIPNGLPFEEGRADFAPDPELVRAGYRAYNRWLVDFCSAAPTRMCGQGKVFFGSTEQAVDDIHEVVEQGLGGIMMPPLHLGGRYFFEPELDPVWRAVEDSGLPLTQHGGTGAPEYNGLRTFEAFMVRAAEHSFFSGRSLWQMILGGVFDRFPGLRLVLVETEAWWIGPMIDTLDRRAARGDDWSDFVDAMGLSISHERLPSEYWRSNCYAGISPFTVSQVSIDGLVGRSEGFAITADQAMIGVDYPHPESIFGKTDEKIAEFVSDARVSDEIVHKVLYQNALDVYGFDEDELAPHAAQLSKSLTVGGGGRR